ncbi:substrate-binding domain-containing protein [Halobaculum sp. MBLA0147]|uniref:substrate-binding domain-containing protein n=1 Tax=Halobaculum sp. MBLA0147 TaxID=3079934 RepID=UPI00352611AD
MADTAGGTANTTEHTTTRRRALRRLGTGLGVGAGTTLAGCVGGGDAVVSVLAAGSLQYALDTRLRERTDRQLSVETRGSAACARMVAEGLRDPDVLALADPRLFDGLATRYTAFATNALVVAYAPDTSVGARVAEADVPFDPLFSADARLGRTDPDADPLGYRTLFALRLARDRWGRDYPSLLAPEQVVPETELLATLATGSLDAVVAYRNMAVDHDQPFRTLPATVDLSTPRHAAEYRQYTYELPDGQVVRGAPITYGATLRHERPATRAVFETLVAGDWLGGGFDVPAAYPTERSV